MKTLFTLGRILFAIAIAFFGAHYLLYISRIVGPPPGPPWIPGAAWLSWLAGAALLVAGICLLIDRCTRKAALVLSCALVAKVLLVHLPRLLMNLHDPGPWTTGAETLSICGGALVLAASIPKDRGPDLSWSGRMAFPGELLYALPLFIVGVQHFLYARFVAGLVPSWIPGHLFWAYFVGAAFFASALAIITGVLRTLAAFLLGLMFLLWVALLHFPRVAASLHNGNEWTSAFIALAMSGAAFVIAGSSESTS